MSSITAITSMHDPVRLENPVTLDLSIHITAPGRHVICFELDPLLPYFFAEAGEYVRKICRRRAFPVEGRHTSRFVLGITGTESTANELSIIATISGLDGTSPPFTAMLPLH